MKLQAFDDRRQDLEAAGLRKADFAG